MNTCRISFKIYHCHSGQHRTMTGAVWSTLIQVIPLKDENKPRQRNERRNERGTVNGTNYIVLLVFT